MGNDVKYTSVYCMKQTMAVLHAGRLHLFDNNVVGEKIKVQREIVQRQNFFNAVVTVVLVGNFENVSILSAVTMVVGLMVTFMAAMMNGDLQS